MENQRTSRAGDRCPLTPSWASPVASAALTVGFGRSGRPVLVEPRAGDDRPPAGLDGRIAERDPRLRVESDEGTVRVEQQEATIKGLRDLTE